MAERKQPQRGRTTAATRKQANRRQPKPTGPSLYELMKDAIGIVDSGIPDLATNPKYMQDFGMDSMGLPKDRP